LLTAKAAGARLLEEAHVDYQPRATDIAGEVLK